MRSRSLRLPTLRRRTCSVVRRDRLPTCAQSACRSERRKGDRLHRMENSHGIDRGYDSCEPTGAWLLLAFALAPARPRVNRHLSSARTSPWARHRPPLFAACRPATKTRCRCSRRRSLYRREPLFRDAPLFRSSPPPTARAARSRVHTHTVVLCPRRRVRGRSRIIEPRLSLLRPNPLSTPTVAVPCRHFSDADLVLQRSPRRFAGRRFVLHAQCRNQYFVEI